MKFKILLRKTPVDEYAHEICYDAFNSNFNSSLYMTYWLFNMYLKSSTYLISNNKLEYLTTEMLPDSIFKDEIEKHNILKIMERMNHEFIKRD